MDGRQWHATARVNKGIQGYTTVENGITTVDKGKQGNNQTEGSDINGRLLGEDMGSSTMDKIDGP